MRVGAGDRPRELGAPAADEAGEADDLARADRERDVVEHARRGCSPATSSIDGRVERRGGFSNCSASSRRAEHAGDEVCLRLLRRGRRPHEAAVAQHRHRVGRASSTSSRKWLT